MTISPAPVSTSISRTASCGSPSRNELDSMPSPVTAPPRVMVFSCGTTVGISPCGSVASTRCSYVVMPCTSAVRASGSTESTRSRPETSSPGRLTVVRGRKRLDVRLASRTGSPAGIAAYCASSRSRASA